MAIETERFRIIVDPENPILWAYEIGGSHDRYGDIVGGFRSSKEARKACERALKAAKKQH